jgi:U6 snRNA phosphodiesterase
MAQASRCGLSEMSSLVVCAWLLWHTAPVGAGAAAGCSPVGSGFRRLHWMATGQGLLEAAVCAYGSDSGGEDVVRVGEDGAQTQQATAAEGGCGPAAPVEAALKRRRLACDAARGQATPQRESAPQISADGRMRSFPHVEGNYAGFVYVPLRGVEGLEAASVEATKIAQEVLTQKCLLHRIHVQDLHISVSRTFALRRVQIKPVVDDLRRTLRALPCFDAAVLGVDLYSNEENTRSFVGLSLSVGATRMQTTTRAVDYALSTIPVEPFYDEMRFHVSVAWFAGAVPQGVPLVLVGDTGVRVDQGSDEGCNGKEKDEQVLQNARLRVSFSVKTIEAKIGAKKYSFKLKEG